MWRAVVTIAISVALLLPGCRRSQPSEKTTGGDKKPGVEQLAHPAANTITRLFDAARDNDLATFKKQLSASSQRSLEQLFKGSESIGAPKPLGWMNLLALHRELNRPKLVSVVSSSTEKVVLMAQRGKIVSRITLVLEHGRWVVDLTRHRNFGALKRVIKRQ